MLQTVGQYGGKAVEIFGAGTNVALTALDSPRDWRDLTAENRSKSQRALQASYILSKWGESITSVFGLFNKDKQVSLAESTFSFTSSSIRLAKGKYTPYDQVNWGSNAVVLSCRVLRFLLAPDDKSWTAFSFKALENTGGILIASSSILGKFRPYKTPQEQITRDFYQRLAQNRAKFK